MILYTTIIHPFRIEHGLSCNEYVFLDIVYMLSTNPVSIHRGWCYMSKNNLAKELDLTKQAVLKMIERLTESGFLERNSDSRFLRTTSKWNEVYFMRSEGKLSLPVIDSQQSLPTVNNVAGIGKESSPEPSKQSLPNKNKILINKIINTLHSEWPNYDNFEMNDKKIIVLSFMDFYKDRKERRKEMTERAMQMFARKAFSLFGTDVKSFVNSVNKSIFKGYTDIYEVKEHEFNNTTRDAKYIEQAGRINSIDWD